MNTAGPRCAHAGRPRGVHAPLGCGGVLCLLLLGQACEQPASPPCLAAGFAAAVVLAAVVRLAAAALQLALAAAFAAVLVAVPWQRASQRAWRRPWWSGGLPGLGRRSCRAGTRRRRTRVVRVAGALVAAAGLAAAARRLRGRLHGDGLRQLLRAADDVLERRARAERGHVGLLDLHGLARARVARGASSTGTLLEHTEAGDVDLLALVDATNDHIDEPSTAAPAVFLSPRRSASASMSWALFTFSPSQDAHGPSVQAD